jgi:two-component system, cell cycle sensor histidine kinase and response regulator CckA
MIEPVMSGKRLSGGKVLVVDDEPSLSRAASRLLHSMGFEVFVATVAQEAVEICRARGAEIDAVLLDYHLQGTTSMEALRQMRSLRPGIKVILMSGYGKPESVANFAGMRLDGFLPKPFGYAEFENVIRAALAQPPRAAD